MRGLDALECCSLTLWRPGFLRNWCPTVLYSRLWGVWSIMAQLPKQRARVAKKAFDYSQFKLSFRNPEDFERFIGGYPDCSGVMAYYYRLVPKIDLSLIGLAETSIYKTAAVSEMNRDFAAGRWGRGKYMLRLSDANRTKGQQEIYRTWFEIDDPDLAAIYDPRSLMVHDPANADEVARLIQSGVMVRDGLTGAARVKTEYTAPAAAGLPSPVVVPAEPPDVLSKDLLSTLILRLVDRGAQSPREQLTQTIEVARLLAPPAAAANPELMELRVQIAELKAARGAGTRSSGLDVFESYTHIESFLKSHSGGGAVVGRRSVVGEIMDGVKELIPHVPAIVEGVMALQARRAATLARAVPAVPAGFVQSSIANRPGAPEGKGAAIPNGSSNLGAVVPLDLTSGDMFSRLVRVGNLALEKMRAGMTGFDFASFLCSSYTPGGLDLFRILAADGTTGVMGLLGQLPEVIAAGPAGRAEIEAFLDDFFTYDPLGGVEESAAVSAAA